MTPAAASIGPPIACSGATLGAGNGLGGATTHTEAVLVGEVGGDATVDRVCPLGQLTGAWVSVGRALATPGPTDTRTATTAIATVAARP
jgi:hypothetical protein